jgi:hypothetical protein
MIDAQRAQIAAIAQANRVSEAVRGRCHLVGVILRAQRMIEQPQSCQCVLDAPFARGMTV